MKPRIFIGSSVEGLSIAYAIQQNLLHVAETTVWDQGVFELSSTIIESLIKALSSFDFGIFVFTPDDVIKIRNNESRAVRDNVLLETGLFIGRLGRERVFFVTPESADIHLPSDLLGVTPGRYDANRSDGSMQAATGPVSHQIKQQIRLLGSLNTDKTAPSEPQQQEEQNENQKNWIYDFIEKRYDVAIEKLRNPANTDDDMSLREKEVWIAYCEFCRSEEIGLEKFSDVSRKFSAEVQIQTQIASFLRFEKRADKAAELLSSLPHEMQELPAIRVALAECHASNEEGEKAIKLLNQSEPRTNPDVAICLANIQEGTDDTTAALKTVISAYANNQRHTQLRYKIARLALDAQHYEIALYLLDELAREFPTSAESAEYLGYFGNCCVELNFWDQAMEAYKKAEAVAQKDESSWIIQNIGNLYALKGFPSEAITHLNRGLALDNDSDYAHARLSQSIKLRNNEQKAMIKKQKEGLQKLREMCRVGTNQETV